MPIPLLAGLALGGLNALGGLFGGRPKTQTQTQNSQFENQGFGYGGNSFENYSDPSVSARDDAYITKALNALSDRMNASADLSGYTAGGLREINAGGDARTKAIQNMLAARGLSFSPAAATQNTLSESARIGDSVNFLNQIPLLQRQMQGNDIQSLLSGVLSAPRGVRNVGTSNFQQNTGQYGSAYGTSTSKGSGNMMGGLFDGIGSALGTFLGLKYGG